VVAAAARRAPTLRDLVELCRSRGPLNQPTSLDAMARRCALSRKHLWSLMCGDKDPMPVTVHRIARGLRVPVAVVEAALDATARLVQR
jgi:hypothetical protein